MKKKQNNDRSEVFKPFQTKKNVVGVFLFWLSFYISLHFSVRKSYLAKLYTISFLKRKEKTEYKNINWAPSFCL